MICSSYDPASLLNTLQFVILSGIDGLNINSIENLSRINSSDGIILDATLTSKSTLAFSSLGIEEMLKEEK